MWKAEDLVMRLPNYSATRPMRTRNAPSRLGMPEEVPKEPIFKPEKKAEKKAEKKPVKKMEGTPEKETKKEAEVKTKETPAKSKKRMDIDVSSLQIDKMRLQTYVDESNDLDDVLFFPTKSEEVRQTLQQLSCEKGSCKAVDLCKVFGYPKSFEHAGELARLGKPSENGFIHGIRYRRSLKKGTNVESTAILKSSQERFADNLVYEYLAGLFLNKYVDKVPSLIETFGLFKYVNESKWEAAREFVKGVASNSDAPTQNIKLLCDAKDPKNCYPENICTQSRSFCLLIQNVKNGKSYEDIVDEYENDYMNLQLQVDMMSSLFHVYFTLASLHGKMTHYDLHLNNVMLYKPFGTGKGIRYVYHFSNGEVEFTSEYLSKIIDYGRSFFPGAKELLDKIAASSDCNQPMNEPRAPKKESRGMHSGFTWHNEERCDIMTNFICPDRFNESHDLRLVYLTKMRLKSIKTHPLKDIKLKYMNQDGSYSNPGGIKGYVSNIREMLLGLRQWFESNTYSNPSLQIVATIHIHEDMKPMSVE